MSQSQPMQASNVIDKPQSPHVRLSQAVDNLEQLSATINDLRLKIVEGDIPKNAAIKEADISTPTLNGILNTAPAEINAIVDSCYTSLAEIRGMLFQE